VAAEGLAGAKDLQKSSQVEVSGEANSGRRPCDDQAAIRFQPICLS